MGLTPPWLLYAMTQRRLGKIVKDAAGESQAAVMVVFIQIKGIKFIFATMGQLIK